MANERDTYFFIMKRLFGSMILVTLLAPSAGAWTFDGTNWVNNGTITFPIAIDATNVINNGTFDFGINPTEFPYDTSNTENFTNTGTMIGSVGFQFDNAPSTGDRKPSANFHNRLTGRITAAELFSTLTIQDGVPIATDLITPSYLLVAATNLINEGVLTAGAGGILRLAGTDVNLSRSGVQIRPINPRGSYNDVPTGYFTPDVGIYDYYWGQTNQVMNSSAIIQDGGAGLVVTSPSTRVQFRPPSAPGFATLQVVNPVGAFYTNTVAFTNITYTNISGVTVTTNVPSMNVVQAVFIGLPVPNNLDWGVRFLNSDNPENPFKTVTVRLTLTSTNVVSISPESASIYLVDTLASGTNRGFYTNFTSVYDLRPQNYLLTRVLPPWFQGGFLGNAPYAPDLLYQEDFASPTVTNDYAAYSAFVDNIASRPPNIPEGTITNLPGRIEIFADRLDMSRTRFRADGLLNINAKHLTANSSNALVDCENLSYTLGSTNGNLKIQNLAQESVSRLKGMNYAWSGFWTNQLNLVFTNYTGDPNDPGAFPVPEPFTNVVQVLLYAMIFDAEAMQTQVPVLVNTLVTHSTNTVINDSMTVVQSFLIGTNDGQGQSFTLNGGITFSQTFFTDTRGNTVVVSLENWVGTNAPGLRFFTNNGTLNIPNEAHFGDDLQTPYTWFVNNGMINAFGQNIQSENCEISGVNLTAGELAIVTGSGKVEGGTINSGGDVRLFANELKFNQATIQTGTRLDLTVTNALFDTGGGSGNAFACTDGFRLLRKPATGDLLGTTVETIAPAFAEVDHVWAGINRGAIPAGFLNNTALGRLVLSPGDYEEWFPPLFFFAGTGGGNALYVDYLDLSQLADYAIEMEINPDLVIYYAAAALGFTPPTTNGIPQQPEEYLDGQFAGRLRWVRDFAGPNSSVDVVVNGVTVKKNRALRNSRILDDDGDGIPNYYDADPFSQPSPRLTASWIQTNQPPTTAVAISWTAAPETIYQVQFTADLNPGNWQTLLKYTNSESISRVVSVWDTNAPAGFARRFYRVSYIP